MNAKTWRDHLRDGVLPPISGGDGTQPPAPPAFDPEAFRTQVASMLPGMVEAAIKPHLEAQREAFKAFARPAESKPAEPGIKATRIIKAYATAKLLGDPSWRKAAWIAEHQMHDPEVAQKISNGLERSEKALQESSGAAGGFLVPVEYAREFIPLLRARTVVRRAGATIIPMNTNSLRINRQATAASASYGAEGANVTKSEQTLEQIELSAKKLTTVVPVSNDLIRDASESVEAFVRDDILRVMALKEDIEFLRGDGSAAKPKGIQFWVAAAQKVASAGSTIANVNADAKGAEKRVTDADVPMLRPGWLLSNRTFQFLNYFLSSAPERYFFRDELNQGKWLGYPYYVTTQIPNNLAPGGTKSEVYFGDFSEVIIGENEQLLFDVFVEGSYWDGTALQSALSRDETVIRVISRHDIALRHDKAFALITEVPWD